MSTPLTSSLFNSTYGFQCVGPFDLCTSALNLCLDIQRDSGFSGETWYESTGGPVTNETQLREIKREHLTLTQREWNRNSKSTYLILLHWKSSPPSLVETRLSGSSRSLCGDGLETTATRSMIATHVQ